MFVTWNGYEIDGSDTTYNLMMPERQKMKELVAFYLSLPIWDKREGIAFDPTESGDWAPHRCVEGTDMDFEPELILQIMEDPTWAGSANFVVCCLPPDELPDELQKEIIALSATRPGAENKTYAMIDPVTYLYDYRDDLGVGFQIFSPKEMKKWKAAPPDGLIFNEKAFEKNVRSKQTAHYGITCGPTFIYEYAAYIMKRLAERFPELGIDGGRDCQGGFTDGCTYCVNLYDYERFTFQTTEVAALLHRLKETGVLRYVLKKGEYGNKWVYHDSRFSFSSNTAWVPSDYTQQTDSMDKNRKREFLGKMWHKARKDNEKGITSEAYEASVKAALLDTSLSDADILFRNAVMVAVDCESHPDPTWENAAYFTVKRSPEGMQVELRVPQELRAVVEKALKACDAWNQ